MDNLFEPTRQRIVGRGGMYGLLSGATIAALSMAELAASVGTPAAAFVYAPFASVVGAVIGAFLGGLIASLVAAIAEPSVRGEVRPATAAGIAATLSATAAVTAALTIGGAHAWPPYDVSTWWVGVVLAATVAGAVSGPALVAPDRRPAAVAARLGLATVPRTTFDRSRR